MTRQTPQTPGQPGAPTPEQTASVQVFGECPRHGAACEARWFECHLSHGAPLLGSYLCTPADPDYPDTPHPDCIREIWEAHPEASNLVYLD